MYPKPLVALIDDEEGVRLAVQRELENDVDLLLFEESNQAIAVLTEKTCDVLIFDSVGVRAVQQLGREGRIKPFLIYYSADTDSGRERVRECDVFVDKGDRSTAKLSSEVMDFLAARTGHVESDSLLDAANGTVPSFFQSMTTDGRIKQVAWLNEVLRMNDGFFVNMLGIRQADFQRWKSKEGSLSERAVEHFDSFWQAMLHLLSFSGFSRSRVLDLFESDARSLQIDESLASKSSLRKLFEEGGEEVPKKVEEWAMSFRFGDDY